MEGSYQHTLLRDEGRLDAYAKAIAQAVTPGDVVADLGSGSGVLAFLAVRAGAARVHAVEAQQHAVANLRALLALNDVADRVVVHEADAERWQPPEPIHVVVCELMETGLLHEPMAAAMRNVHAWVPKPRAIVPGAARLLVEGVASADVFHGYRARLASFRATGQGEALTDAACYAEYDFAARAPPEGVDATFALRARRDGVLDALRLRTLTYPTPWLTYETGPGYCTPIVLPLEAPVRVRADDTLEGKLAYTFAFDAQPLRYELAR